MINQHTVKGALAMAAGLLLTMVLTWSVGRFQSFARPIAAFFLLMLICLAATNAASLRYKLTEWLNAFARFLDRRGAFRSNPEAELPKFALIRMAFGALMFERSIWILVYFQPSDWSDASVCAVALMNMLAAIFVGIGFGTQVALAYLVLFQWQAGEPVLGNSTLGNDIAAMLSMLLVLANAGAHFSVDSILRKKRGLVGRLAGCLYYDHGVPPANTLQIAKFLTLFAYWCVCLYSLSMHLGEQAWMNGTAGPLLLTSNFMSRYSGEFSYFFETGPSAVMLGRIALWAMLPWYALLIPSVLIGGAFRAYAIIWGLLFFALSLFILQLGWLAQFEFLMFAGLFWQRHFITSEKLHVAYDDRCNLCDRTVQFIKAVDIFRRVELRPLSQNQSWLRSAGIDPGDAMTDLHGVDGSGKLSRGYDFYLALSKHVFVLIPFFPILWIGRSLGGPAIYRYIADRRTQLFGVCQIPSPKAAHRLLPVGSEAPTYLAKGDPIAYVSMHLAVLCFFYLLAMPAPYLGWRGAADPFGATPTVAGAAHFYGVAPINVFNAADLRLSENWFTIAFVAEDGKKMLLPILSDDGKRLAMHRSDRVYFGNTLRFRRGMIDHSECAFETYKTIFQYLTQAAKAKAASGYFIYDQFAQPLPELNALLAGTFATSETQRVCEVQF